MVTERRTTGVNHKSTSPQDYEHLRSDLCVISRGKDNRHAMVPLGRKGTQKESKVAERKGEEKCTDPFQPASPGHSVKGRPHPAGTQQEL